MGLRKTARALAVLLLFGTACSKPSKRTDMTAQSSAVCDVSGSDHDTLYRRGVDLIQPHMLLVDRKAAPRNDAEVRVGIACMDRVLDIDPSNWSALWIRGKAFQSLGQHEKAVESFRSAYRINAGQPDVAREFEEELLETEHFREAADIARAASDRSPRNAGLKANLALALLLSGDASSAQQAITEALRLDPTDPISKALARRIFEVASGARPQPKSLGELQRRD